MKSDARAVTSQRRPFTPAPGPGRSLAWRLLFLSALAGGGFLIAYVLTRLGAQAAPPGMRWVPPGEFLMGTQGPGGPRNERPAHRVRVNGFWMDETEVTNAQFRAFVLATGHVTTAERTPTWEELKKYL